MKTILAIDTSLRSCSVGLMRGDAVVSSVTQTMPRGQDQALPETVERVMAEASINVPDLTHIAVTTGPGSFTGIRVGMAFARGLASVLKIPLIGLTTTQVLSAQTSEKSGATCVIIKIKNDAYVAELFNDNQSQSNLTALNQDELIQFLVENNVQNVITHDENCAEFITQPCHVALPNPVDMLSLVSQVEDSYNALVRPVYVRDADVTLKTMKN